MHTKSILIGALGLAGMAHQSAYAQEWPMYQGNASHTGYLDIGLSTDATNQAWTSHAQPRGISGIAITNGVVITTPQTYFNASAPIVAQDIVTGNVLWTMNVPNVYSVNWPVSDGSNFYFQVSDNWQATYLYSYTLNGVLNWRSPFASQWENYLGPIVVDGKLYMDGGSYGGVYSFNAANGAQQWYTSLPQYDAWSPTWWNGMLVVYTNRLDVIDASTGHPTTTISDPNYVWSGYSADQAPVVVGNLAYVTNGGRLVAFDFARKTIAWTQAISATGQVATDGNELFVISGGALTSRDPATGALLWSWIPSPTGKVVSNLIVTQTHVIASDGKNTYLVNRDAHATDLSYAAGGDILAFGEQTLVVASSTSGVLSAFDVAIELQACVPPTPCPGWF